jgi:hypothetical protein
MISLPKEGVWQEEIPCLCGRGRLTIEHWRAGVPSCGGPVTCMAHHIIPHDQQLREPLTCSDCERDFAVKLWPADPECPDESYRLRHLRYRRRRDIEARAAAEQARHAAWLADPDVRDEIRLMRDELSALPTLAQRRRWLVERGLWPTGTTPAEFRRDWERDPGSLVSEIVRHASQLFGTRGAEFLHLDAAWRRVGAIELPKVEEFWQVLGDAERPTAARG